MGGGATPAAPRARAVAAAARKLRNPNLTPPASHPKMESISSISIHVWNCFGFHMGFGFHPWVRAPQRGRARGARARARTAGSLGAHFRPENGRKMRRLKKVGHQNILIASPVPRLAPRRKAASKPAKKTKVRRRRTNPNRSVFFSIRWLPPCRRRRHRCAARVDAI